MTLYVRAEAKPYYQDEKQPPSFTFKLEGKEDILKFQSLLNRSLNCAPEFGRDWFELSDKLEAFLKQIA